MFTTKHYAAFLGAILFMASCQEAGNDEETPATDTTEARKEVTLSNVSNSPEFPDAKLTIASVTPTKQGDSVKVTFNFNVQNYELKTQTDDAESKNCANSDQGQHIHFILDNQPYVALYEPKHEVTLAKGTEHTLLAFLSRSYHESIKTKDASILYHFTIDDNGNLKKLPEQAGPMVFYSRPKGDYVGEKNTENVLFDFYLWNTELGNDVKVKAEILAAGSNEVQTIMVDEWKPTFLNNLPMGENTIKLTLVDGNGNPIESPEGHVERTFTLSKDEPLP